MKKTYVAPELLTDEFVADTMIASVCSYKDSWCGGNPDDCYMQANPHNDGTWYCFRT